MSDTKIRVPINSDKDIVVARQEGRTLAMSLGFSPGDATLLATAISELARNIVAYANVGEILLATTTVNGAARLGMQVVARDEGPGIADVQQALRDGFSTSGGLGLGLPGVRRLVDEFQIVSDGTSGTTVTIRKWKP